MTTPARARLGALCWAAAMPLFVIANIVVGLAWDNPRFSWVTNNVSDLGNVHCGIWDSTRPRYVCSPWHSAMNVSLWTTALLLIVGLLLTWRLAGHGLAVRAAQSLLVLGATGLGLAGAFPADVNEDLHFLGALLLFGLGNLGLVVAGLAPRNTILGRVRVISLLLGLLALSGTVLFFAQQGLGIGVGGMERVALFPQLAWAFYVATVQRAALTGVPARQPV